MMSKLTKLASDTQRHGDTETRRHGDTEQRFICIEDTTQSKLGSKL